MESKTALTEVAISLTLDPAAAVTDELPRIPWIVNDSACTKFASDVSETAYAFNAKLSLSTALFAISVVSVPCDDALYAPILSNLIEEIDN